MHSQQYLHDLLQRMKLIQDCANEPTVHNGVTISAIENRCMVYAQDQLLEIKMLIMNLIVLGSTPPMMHNTKNIKDAMSNIVSKSKTELQDIRAAMNPNTNQVQTEKLFKNYVINK